MVFPLCALWSMSIFDGLKICEFLSEKKIFFVGPTKLLDEDEFFLFSRFCFFRSLETYDMISVSIFLVFA